MGTQQTARTISFRIAQEKVEALDAIAKSMDRDRSYLLNQAVETYLFEQQRFAASVAKGREDIQNGKFLSQEDVERKVEEWEREDR
jgi:RHH-type rel operon transcriptional repressor/antitoxin RelB